MAVFGANDTKRNCLNRLLAWPVAGAVKKIPEFLVLFETVKGFTERDRAKA
jgi:hypothetical protein